MATDRGAQARLAAGSNTGAAHVEIPAAERGYDGKGGRGYDGGEEGAGDGQAAQGRTARSSAGAAHIEVPAASAAMTEVWR